MAGLMVHSPADVVRKLLVDLNLGTDPDTSPGAAWPVFAYSEPTLPDVCITVYDTAGTDDGRTKDGLRAVHEGLQVRIRSTIPSLGYTKANAIAVALDRVNRNPVTMEGDGLVYEIESVNRTGNVIPLGKESPSSKRSLFTLNATITLHQLP